MTLELCVTAQRRFRVEAGTTSSVPLSSAVKARIEAAFRHSQGPGLLHLGTVELETALPPSLAFARELAQKYLVRLCHLGEVQSTADHSVEMPPDDELTAFALDAPPMTGIEYLDADTLRSAWLSIDAQVRFDSKGHAGGVRGYLHHLNPLWRLVGRVMFHLAENKRDSANPFAFLATYAGRISDTGSAQHMPLSRALQEYAGSKNRRQLAALLSPIRAAGEHLPWVQELVDSGAIYHPLAWSPGEAHRFLRSVPVLEASGLVVRIPDWWQPNRAPRAQVAVRIGDRPAARLGIDALLDFSADLALDGKPLTSAEQRELIASTGGLVRLRGQWIEADGGKLAAALAHWKQIEAMASSGGISFFQGMRLLAGMNPETNGAGEESGSIAEWTGIEPGEWLREVLAKLRDPETRADAQPLDLRATLRPYQLAGVAWLAFLSSLGLGACLADDMGLGKTVQVLALMLRRKVASAEGGGLKMGERQKGGGRPPSLVVAPASLIANWKAELDQFAPTLVPFVAHPSEATVDWNDETAVNDSVEGADIVITTYGMLGRVPALRRRVWDLAVLDEAQAIKNPAARQTRAVKELRASSRIALTGTPVENRLSDLWSLFDFLNPGLLGSAAEFGRIAKRLSARADQPFAPIRRLVQPYILRRMKTDKRVIADLPDKTEVRTFCGLTREQAALYQARVVELQRQLERARGIERRGIVLATLMQLKQICNHPAHWQGQGDYSPARSGKFERLTILCEELAARQERALVFTQFRELTEPLARHLATVWGRPGLVLHGGTTVSKRQSLVQRFQEEDGPPFFVLSLKAGGTGLNLTAASQVIHFDRWWNPAVENQATDRAFRIGQRRPVLVHKFVCRGTVEEKIDALIESKVGLARDLLDESGEGQLTEMSDEQLLSTVALDLRKACES